MPLYRIEKYLRNTRTPPTRFARDVLGDSRFVFDLRSGREPQPSTVRKVSSFLDREFAYSADDRLITRRRG